MEKEPFLFDHEETLKDIHNLSLEAHRLPETELKDYAARLKVLY